VEISQFHRRGQNTAIFAFETHREIKMNQKSICKKQR